MGNLPVHGIEDTDNPGAGHQMVLEQFVPSAADAIEMVKDGKADPSSPRQ